MANFISLCVCSGPPSSLSPRVPPFELKLREYGIKPCYVRLNYIGLGPLPGPLIYPAAKRSWECLLCLEQFDFAEGLHTHVRVVHALLHDCFRKGLLPCLQKCQFCG